jgi:hypothetical protein
MIITDPFTLFFKLRLTALASSNIAFSGYDFSQPSRMMKMWRLSPVVVKDKADCDPTPPDWLPLPSIGLTVCVRVNCVIFFFPYGVTDSNITHHTRDCLLRILGVLVEGSSSYVPQQKQTITTRHLLKSKRCMSDLNATCRPPCKVYSAVARQRRFASQASLACLWRVRHLFKLSNKHKRNEKRQKRRTSQLAKVLFSWRC